MTDIYMVETCRKGRWFPVWPFMSREGAIAQVRKLQENLGHHPARRIMVYRAESDLLVTEGVYACEACDATYTDILEMDTDLPWLCPPCARDHDAAEVSRQEEAAAKAPDPEPQDFDTRPVPERDGHPVWAVDRIERGLGI